jgi:hypothetical protein
VKKILLVTITLAMTTTAYADRCDDAIKTVNQITTNWKSDSSTCEKAKANLDYYVLRLQAEHNAKNACGSRLITPCDVGCNEAKIVYHRADVTKYCKENPEKKAEQKPKCITPPVPRPYKGDSNEFSHMCITGSNRTNTDPYCTYSFSVNINGNSSKGYTLRPGDSHEVCSLDSRDAISFEKWTLSPPNAR